MTTPEIYLDLCGLEPPEPMQRVLEALDAMQQGQHVRMLIDREPHPLYRILERNGYRYATAVRDGYLYEITIRQAS